MWLQTRHFSFLHLSILPLKWGALTGWLFPAHQQNHLKIVPHPNPTEPDFRGGGGSLRIYIFFIVPPNDSEMQPAWEALDTSGGPLRAEGWGSQCFSAAAAL